MVKSISDGDLVESIVGDNVQSTIYIIDSTAEPTMKVFVSPSLAAA
jgi:hypothetical protein